MTTFTHPQTITLQIDGRDVRCLLSTDPNDVIPRASVATKRPDVHSRQVDNNSEYIHGESVWLCSVSGNPARRIRRLAADRNFKRPSGKFDRQ